MAVSSIQWLHPPRLAKGAVWNPVTGCRKISEGCRNCYAERNAQRFWKSRKFTSVQTHFSKLGDPLKLKRGRMIFVNSMSDLFHEDIPIQFIENVYDIMRVCTQHIFIILTKRPERMFDFYKLGKYGTIPNIWIGVSAEGQYEYMYRGSILKQTPAYRKIISLEPLLEEIELNYEVKPRFTPQMTDKLRAKDWDWVLIGAESGPKRRACNNEWIQKAVHDCAEVNTPIFVKQIHEKQVNNKTMLIDNIAFFPFELQRQQFPATISEDLRDAARNYLDSFPIHDGLIGKIIEARTAGKITEIFQDKPDEVVKKPDDHGVGRCDICEEEGQPLIHGRCSRCYYLETENSK